MLEVKTKVFWNPLGTQRQIPSSSSLAVVLWRNCLSLLLKKVSMPEFIKTVRRGKISWEKLFLGYLPSGGLDLFFFQTMFKNSFYLFLSLRLLLPITRTSAHCDLLRIFLCSSSFSHLVCLSVFFSAYIVFISTLLWSSLSDMSRFLPCKYIELAEAIF